MSWVRNGKFFAIRPGEKLDIPQAKRYIGVEGNEEFFNQYMNQILEECQRVDYILGSAADLTLGACNVKWNGANFVDENAATVTFASGDRIAIVSFDGGAVTFTPSNLYFEMEPDVEIDLTGITFTLSGAGHRGMLNFTNAPDKSVVLSGSSMFLDIRTDNPEAVSNTGENDLLINGNHSIHFLPNFENNIINSNSSIAQQGTSFLALTDGQYTLDMQKHRKTGTMVFSAGQQSLGLGLYSNRYTVTTAQASLGVSDYAADEYIVTGYDYVKYLQAGWGTYSFKIKSNVTGKFFIAFQNSGNDRSYVTSYTINAAGVEEQKTLTVPMTETGGTWDYANGAGLRIFSVMAAGTALETAEDTWTTGNYLSGTGGGANIASAVSNYFEISERKFRPGNVFTGYMVPDYQEDLADAQRYLWRGLPFGQGNFGSSASGFVQTWGSQFPVRMRTTATLTYDFTGASLTNVSSLTAGASTDNGYIITAISNAVTVNASFGFAGSNYIQGDARL